jgi:hypothetical protein
MVILVIYPAIGVRQADWIAKLDGGVLIGIDEKALSRDDL